MTKRKTITAEELLASRLKEHLDKVQLIPEPPEHRKFKIGDKVHIGNLTNCVISNIYADGKIYEVTYSYTDRDEYNQPVVIDGAKNIWEWMSIFKEQLLNEVPESQIKNDDIFISYSNTSLSNLLNTRYYFGINMSPDYQRDYVWTADDKVKLIDSIFNNRDIGKFVFIHSDDYTAEYMYEILDGKQRLNAIFEFYEDRFKYNGLYFSEMCVRDRNFFENYNVCRAELRHMTKDQIIRMFIMLNTGGRQMKDEDIQRAVSLLK